MTGGENLLNPITGYNNALYILKKQEDVTVRTMSAEKRGLSGFKVFSTGILVNRKTTLTLTIKSVDNALKLSIIFTKDPEFLTWCWWHLPTQLVSKDAKYLARWGHQCYKHLVSVESLPYGF